MTQAILALAALGFVLSLYASYVEKKARTQKKYKAVCDISKGASCTAAFTSDYGTHFGISNSVAGIGFYLVVLALTWYGFALPVFWLCAASVAGSAYLAYVLYVKLRNMCVVCSVIYVVNIALFILSWRALG